jgi:hypothetical protein
MTQTTWHTRKNLSHAPSANETIETTVETEYDIIFHILLVSLKALLLLPSSMSCCRFTPFETPELDLSGVSGLAPQLETDDGKLFILQRAMPEGAEWKNEALARSCAYV